MRDDMYKNEMVKEEELSKDQRFNDAVSESVEEAPETMSALEKILNIVIAPTKALKAIKAKPTILIVMILLPFFSLLYYLLCWSSYEAQAIQMIEQQFASQGVPLTREMLALQMQVQRYLVPIGSFVGTYFTVLIATVFYFAIGKFMKKSLTFKQTFSMILHVSIVSSLIWFVHIAITKMTGTSDLMAPMTSLASFLPSSMDGSLVSYLLMPIEVFTIWYIYVLYLGLRIVGDYSKKAATITAVVTLLISILLTLSSYMMTALL